MTGGTKVKRFVIGGTAAAAFCGASALAADLPTKAPPALAPPPSCFASFYDYINASAQDCPLAWSGITLYGAIDIGADYVTHGVPFNGAYPQGVEPLISKNSQGARYSIAPNGLGQSVVGIKGTEEFAQGISLAAIAKATAPMELTKRRSAATLAACRSTRSIAT